MPIVYTNHAIQRKLERNISDNEIEKILSEPDYMISSFEERKIAVKTISAKTLHVVYKAERNNIIVITVY